MVRESASGTRTPQGSDAFSPTSQLADLADDEAQWNNFIRVADIAARNALSSPELRDGILVETLDTHIVWQWFEAAAAWRTVNSVSCVLGKSASQSLTTSLTAVSWDVEVSDVYGMHDNSVNNTRVTAPVAGLYEVTVFVYNNNTTGLGIIQARKNGSSDIQGSFTRRTATTDAAIPLDKTFPVVLAAGDYIEIMASHSAAAGTVGGGTTAGSSTLTMKRIG